MRPLPSERPPGQDLPPMRVNTVTMVLVGIGVWVVALVVAVVLRAAGTAVDDGVLRVCGAGVVLGLLALTWAVPQHRRDQRDEARRAAGRAADPGTGAPAADATAPATATPAPAPAPAPANPRTTTPKPAREDGHP